METVLKKRRMKVDDDKNEDKHFQLLMQKSNNILSWKLQFGKNFKFKLHENLVFTLIHKIFLNIWKRVWGYLRWKRGVNNEM